MNCTGSTWQQQWDCGWNDHHAVAWQVGHLAGVAFLPVAVLLVAVLILRRRHG